MEATIDLKEFKKAIETIKPYLPKRSFLPILNNAFAEIHNNELTLTCYTLSRLIQVTTPIAHGIDGTCLIPVKEVSDIIKAIKQQGNIQILSKDRTIDLTVTGVTFALSTMAVDDYPLIPGINVFGGYVVESKQFIQAKNFVVEASGSGKFHDKILFDFAEDKLTLVGTDGNRLHAYTLLHDIAPSKQYVIPVEDFAKVNPIDQTIEFDFDAEKFYWSSGNCKGSIYLSDSTWPTWRSVIPNPCKDDCIITFNGKDAYGWIKSIASLCNDMYQTLLFSLTKDTITFSNYVDEIPSLITMSCSVKHPLKSRYGVNVDYLLYLMKTFSHKLDIRIRDNLYPIVVEHDDYLAVIMPIQVKDGD
mgnify:CR=1 FL=1